MTTKHPFRDLSQDVIDRRAADVAFRSVTGLRLGWVDLTGRPSRWEDILQRLRSYSLLEVLDYLTRISAVLLNAEGTGKDEQYMLCRGLFGDSAEALWEQLNSYANDKKRSPHGRAPIVLFDEISVALATKFALRNLSATAAPTQAPLRALGEALLMLNDKVDENPPNGVRLGPALSAESLESVAYYLYVVGAFRFRESWVHAMARAYDLFMTDHRQLRERSNRLLKNPVNLLTSRR